MRYRNIDIAKESEFETLKEALANMRQMRAEGKIAVKQFQRWFDRFADRCKLVGFTIRDFN